MDLLFDEETINRIHDKAIAREAMVELLVRQFKEKKISAKEGADYLGISANEFLDLVNS